MSYPKYLFKDIYWSFAMGSISTAEAFVSEMEQYYKAISGRKFPLRWNDLVFDYPKMELQYVKYTDDEVEEPFELIEADNGQNFTVKELLFKVHKVGVNLQNDDNCYFEGLLYSEDENDDGVPIYFLMSGS